MINDCNQCSEMYPKEPYYYATPHTQHVCGKTGYICYHDREDNDSHSKELPTPMWCPLLASSPFNEIKRLKKQVEELQTTLTQLKKD